MTKFSTMKKFSKYPSNTFECVKQPLVAMIITLDNKVVFGRNSISVNVPECPRVTEGFKTGEGYHLCKEVCNQGSHAEVNAIEQAHKDSIDITDATLFLIGHTYCCSNCLNEMKLSGIKKVFIIDENDKVIKDYSL